MTLTRSRLPRPARCAVAVAVSLAALLGLPGAALADSATLTVTDAAGQPDPVVFIGRTFTVAGNSAIRTHLWVKYRPAGGAACAPSFDTDSGISLDPPITGGQVEGDFRVQAARTWRSPGTFLFCIWLSDFSGTVSSPFTQTITFRSPTGTITAAVNPVIPRPGQAASVTVTGQSEAPMRAFAKVRAGGGAACAPTYDADSGENLISGDNVNGAFSLQATTTQDAPGSYLICLWLAQSGSDPAPIGGPQPQTFDVVQPPPVVSSARVLNCRTHHKARSFRARRTASICLRYRFSTTPLAGEKITVRFISPAHRTVKTLRTTWPTGTSRTLTLGSLRARSYRRRHGTWQVILRVSGKKRNTTSFRIK